VVCEDERERLIKVEWGQTDAIYPVNIQVEAWDRVGLIRDITVIVAEEKVNIATMSFTNHDDHSISLHLILETRGLAQLSRLLAKVDGVRGVMNVSRVVDEVTTKASPPVWAERMEQVAK
jgi:GTP pyrophosphokinase